MKKKLFILLASLWMGSVSYLLMHMHAWHQVAVQAEITKKDLSLIPAGPGQFAVVHFLGEGCGCSKIIAEYLIKRKVSQVSEQVWLLGGMQEYASALEAAGFKVGFFKVSDQDAPPINAVPAFGVYDQKQKFHYMGAYTDGPVRPHSEFKDLFTINSIKKQRQVASLDVQGCMVSKQYQKLLDPFGIKYGDTP